jgi:hypothetical protein
MNFLLFLYPVFMNIICIALHLCCCFKSSFLAVMLKSAVFDVKVVSSSRPVSADSRACRTMMVVRRPPLLSLCGN